MIYDHMWVLLCVRDTPSCTCADKQLTKKLQQTEADLAQANALFQHRLDDAQADWARQVADLELQWEKRCVVAVREAEAKLGDDGREWERHMRELEMGWRNKINDVEQQWGE